MVALETFDIWRTELKVIQAMDLVTPPLLFEQQPAIDTFIYLKLTHHLHIKFTLHKTRTTSETKLTSSQLTEGDKPADDRPCSQVVSLILG